MQDNDLDNLLCDWSNAQLPDDAQRNPILRNVLARPGRRTLRRVLVAALSGIVAVAASLLLLLTPPPEQIVHHLDPVASNDDGTVRVSLIVLKQLPDSDTAVEFLEDTIILVEENNLHELALGEHRLFLWVYPLEKTLFSVDIGVDKAAETGIVAVPDRSQAFHLQSNGDSFDVFVSVLPIS